MSDKPTNPKDAIGVRKPPLSTVPVPPLMEIGAVMAGGAAKYGRHNWREAGVRASVYFDAAVRHLFKWWEGEDIDPESGLPHLMHAAACLLVYRDAELRGLVNDDRPPRTPGPWLDALQGAMDEIAARYPEPVAPITQVSIDLPRIVPIGTAPAGCASSGPIGTAPADASRVVPLAVEGYDPRTETPGDPDIEPNSTCPDPIGMIDYELARLGLRR